MLYDRSYMRATPSTFKGSSISIVAWLVIINVGIFLLDATLLGFSDTAKMRGISPIGEHFSLSISNLESFKIWALLSYSFLHNGLFHILANMLIIYFLGKHLEVILGKSRFIWLFTLGVFVGGLCSLLGTLLTSSAGDSFARAIPLMGASAGACALITYFCVLQPNRPTTLLLFFVIPITVKPKWVLVTLVSLDLLGLLGVTKALYQGLFGGGANISHAAHLGGYLGGFIAFWLFTQYQISSQGGGITMEPPKWMKRNKVASAAKQKFKVNISSRQEMQNEVDRILDKINNKGFGSLTLQEKETLDRAKEFLKK